MPPSLFRTSTWELDLSNRQGDLGGCGFVIDGVRWGESDRESIGAGAQHRPRCWRIHESARNGGGGVQLCSAKRRPLSNGRWFLPIDRWRGLIHL